MKATYKSDFIVNRLHRVFGAVYGLVFVSAALIFTATFSETLNHYLHQFYTFLPLSPKSKVIALGLFICALFTLTPIFNSIVYLTAVGRNFFFSKKKFDSVKTMPILSKLERSGGTSESDWSAYFFIVSHPVSNKKMHFEVAEKLYDSYEEGDPIEVRYHPNIGSILYLQLTENTEKQKIIREKEAKRGNFKWYIFGRRVK